MCIVAQKGLHLSFLERMQAGYLVIGNQLFYFIVSISK